MAGSTGMRRPQAVRPTVVMLAAVAVVALATAYAGIELTKESGRIAVVWPTNGIVLSLILNRNRNKWASLLVPAVLGNVAADLLAGDTIGSAVFLSLCNLLEICVAVGGIRLAGIRVARDLLDLGNLLRATAVSCIVAPALSAALASAFLWGATAADFAVTWRTWFAADALGMMIFAPLAGSLHPGLLRDVKSARAIAGLVLAMVLVAVVTAAVFFSPYPFLFLVMPALVFAAFRFEQVGTVIAVIVIAAIAIYATETGRGPFQMMEGVTPRERVFLLQGFLAVCVATAFPIATLRRSARRATRRLSEREEELRRVLDNSTDMIFRLTLDGVRTFVSRASVRLLGREPDKLIGTRPLDQIHPDDVAKARAAFDSLWNLDTEVRLTNRIRHADGHWVWVEAGLTMIRDARTGEPKEIFGSLRDISERIAAQSRETSHDELFRVMVEGIVDYAVIMLNPDGTVATWNKGAERLQGYTGEQIIGQHFSRFYSDEDVAGGEPQRLLERARLEGKVSAAGWSLRRDGSRFWGNVVIDALYSPSGKLLGFVKVTRDETEARAQRAALEDSEQRFRLLLDAVRDTAIYLLDAEGRVASWNAGAETIKGYAAHEVLGRHFSMFYPETAVNEGEPRRALEAARREGRYAAESRHQRKDGSTFRASVVITPLTNARGEVVGFAKVTRDLSANPAPDRLRPPQASG